MPSLGRFSGGPEVLVEEVGAHCLVVDTKPMHSFPVLIVVEPGQLGVGQPGPGLPGRGHQDAGEVVANQRIDPSRFGRASSGDPQRGGADEFGDGPTVAGGSQRRGQRRQVVEISHVLNMLPE